MTSDPQTVSSKPNKNEPNFEKQYYSEEHIILQEIDAFNIKYGSTYSDSAISMQTTNKKVPAVCYFASNHQNAKPGKQGYNSLFP